MLVIILAVFLINLIQMKYYLLHDQNKNETKNNNNNTTNTITSTIPNQAPQEKSSIPSENTIPKYYYYDDEMEIEMTEKELIDLFHQMFYEYQNQITE